MTDVLSIAIETSCRQGGVACGRGDALLAEVAFDASQRAATQLVCRLKEMLEGIGSNPTDVEELYVCVGPGSFTGTRVGVTVARTLAQAVPALRCVAVPASLAVADNCRELEWQNLGVVLDAGDGLAYATTYVRCGSLAQPVDPGAPAIVAPAAEVLGRLPRPITLVGEGLSYHELTGEGITRIAAGMPVHLPSARGVWAVGRRMAQAGQFTEYHHLLPIYSRQPEAVRLWEQRHGPGA